MPVHITSNIPTYPIVDLDAQHYIVNSGLQLDLAGEILAGIDFPQDAKVLDVGCGDGRITSEIAKRVPYGQVTGLDASTSMVGLARETYLEASSSNLAFLQSTAEDFSIEGELDFATSFSAFHWFRGAKGVLKSLCEALKPNGELIILTYPAESIYYEFMQEALNERFKEFAPLSAYNTMLSIDEYKSTILDAKMDLTEFTRKDLFTSSQTFQEVKEFIRGWLTSFVPLPEHLHDEFLDLVIEKCKPYVQYGRDHSINLPYTELIIKASRLS